MKIKRCCKRGRGIIKEIHHISVLGWVLACNAFKFKLLSLLTSAGQSVYYIGTQHLLVSFFYVFSLVLKGLFCCYKCNISVFILLKFASCHVHPDILKKGCSVHPELLQKEVEAVVKKHRTPEYCNQLLQHISSLPTETADEDPE